MKIEYQKKQVGNVTTFSKLDRKCFVAAVIVAFISVFVWFFKILFF